MVRQVFERIKNMFILGYRQLQDPYYHGVAAQVAFFFMLSIVPALILFSQLLSFVHISTDTISEYLEIEITQDFIGRIEYLFSFEPQTGTNIMLLLAAIWAASRLQFILMRVANYMLTDGEDSGDFLKDRGRSLITMLLTIFVMVVMVLVLVYGQVVINFLADKFMIKSALDVAWRYLRWPVTAGLYLLLISFNYYVLPHSRSRFKDVLPGGVFCSLGMLVVTMVYSAYTNYAVNRNIIYGSMASFAALMFWFYFISWVMILGILVNKVWSDTKRRSDTEKH